MRSPSQLSAGLLMYRGSPETLEVFLAHPGGPFFAKRDAGAWTIPKGLVEATEDPRKTAVREFSEEIGLPAGEPLIHLGHIVQKGGKKVLAWAFRGTVAPGFRPRSNTFEIEWPSRSGRMQEFPEIDQARFFDIEKAREKLNPAQIPFVERLLEYLSTCR